MEKKNNKITIKKRLLTSAEKSVTRKSLYLKNLDPDATPGLLVEMMRKFGPVFRPRIIPNEFDPTGPVFGFVDLRADKAEKALRHFKKYELVYNNRVVSISLALSSRTEHSNHVDDHKVEKRVRKFYKREKFTQWNSEEE